MGLPSTLEEYQGIVDEFAAGSVVESIEPLKGGISAEISLLTVRRKDGSHHKFVARCPGDWGDEDYAGKAVREARKYRFAFEQGLLAPEPVACFPERNFFVLRYLDGSPNLSKDQADAFVEVVAPHLAKIHETPLTDADRDWLPRANDAPSGEGWQPAVRDAVFAHGHPSFAPSHLCHGDCWPGNVLWNGRDLAGVIDWEEMHLGFPLSDLAIARLDLLFAFDWDIVDAFTDAYFRVSNTDPEWLPYWDLRCSQRIGNAYEEWASSFAPLGRPEITADTLRQCQAEFIARALERI